MTSTTAQPRLLISVIMWYLKLFRITLLIWKDQ